MVGDAVHFFRMLLTPPQSDFVNDPSFQNCIQNSQNGMGVGTSSVDSRLLPFFVSSVFTPSHFSPLYICSLSLSLIVFPLSFPLYHYHSASFLSSLHHLLPITFSPFPIQCHSHNPCSIPFFCILKSLIAVPYLPSHLEHVLIHCTCLFWLIYHVWRCRSLILYYVPESTHIRVCQ